MYLADREVLNVVQVGVRDVDIVLPNKNVWALQKIRHIFELKKNLIFVGQLNDGDHSIAFSGGIWKVTKGEMALVHGQKTGSLFMTLGSSDVITTT